MAPSEGLQVIQEYYDPRTGDLLEVEAPTAWYPLLHDFEPDIEAFYRDWLGLPLPERAASWAGATIDCTQCALP